MANGMTFNSVTSSSLSLEYCSPRVPLLPDRRSVTAEITGRDGSYDFSRDSYAPRLIPVDCLIKATSEADLTTKLKAIAVWLSGSGWLVFDADTTVRWWAKVYAGIDQTRVPAAALFTVLFECYPYAEDVSATTGTIGTAQDYGSAVEFYPTITVTLTADAAFVQVALTSTGEYVRVDGDYDSGDVFVFNMSTGNVTRNGAACMADMLIDSIPFGIPPGTHTVTPTATGTFTSSISYRKRYLYA